MRRGGGVTCIEWAAAVQQSHPSGDRYRALARRSEPAGASRVTEDDSQATPNVTHMFGTCMPSSAAFRHPPVVGKIEQDYLRRVLLREHDTTSIDVAAPAVIAATARAALAHGYHVIVEGMMLASRYATTLRELIAGHHGPSHVFYLDVSLQETLSRHRGKDGLDGVTDEHVRSWYTERDLLGVPAETVIDESSTFEHTVTTILHESGLASTPPLAACPARCPRCQGESGCPADQPVDARMPGGQLVTSLPPRLEQTPDPKDPAAGVVSTLRAYS